ncbi:cytochrome P450 3A8-like [Tachypleus tridentatus]|uniref:cytochrome P450 3A8-like n=1 Tax=Tachypleus tridentatus TaxID=6853 RepID=UPI003FD23BD3
MDLLGLLFIHNWLVYTVAIVLALYFYFIRNNGYWERRGVPELKDKYPFQNTIQLILKPLHELDEERYKKFGKIYGKFEGSTPALVVAEPELIKQIMVKDFHAFNNRRDIPFGDSVLDKMLTVLMGEEWKQTRSIISPTFSGSKMKKMSYFVQDTIKSLLQNLENAADKKEVIDCKKYFGAFTMDTIATCAFGTRVDSHKHPDSPFVKYARQIFNANLKIGQLLVFIFPKLSRIFRINFISQEVTDFFRNTTNQIIEFRKKNNEKRNDFLQLMLDAKESIQDVDEQNDEINSIGNAHGHEDEVGSNEWKPIKQKILTHEDILANSILFFLVGYDTTANALTYAVYSLARNPECQEKLIQEIDAVWEKHGGIDYETVGKMTYLDCVLSETLRLFSIAVVAERRATKDYQLGDTGITIPKDMIIQIPIYAIHHDPEYYPNPNAFEPERFLPENKTDRHPYSYIPFGAGPRNCVGMRFALMEAKFCLVHVLRCFRFQTCPETKEKLEFFIGQGILQAKEVSLRIEKRTDI